VNLAAVAQVQTRQAGQRSEVREAAIADLLAAAQVQIRQAAQCGEVREAAIADLMAPLRSRSDRPVSAERCARPPSLRLWTDVIHGTRESAAVLDKITPLSKKRA
jgi:hypothetical protein